MKPSRTERAALIARTYVVEAVKGLIVLGSVATIVGTLYVATAKGESLAERLKAAPADIRCLAQNVYFEARGEPLAGQVAVAQVTINRVLSGRFAPNICGVVFAPDQFSWTAVPTVMRERDAWERALALAYAMLGGQHHGATPSKSTRPDLLGPIARATHFHAVTVSPRWARALRKVGRIGGHVFYVEEARR